MPELRMIERGVKCVGDVIWDSVYPMPLGAPVNPNHEGATEKYEGAECTSCGHIPLHVPSEREGTRSQRQVSSENVLNGIRG